MFEQTFELHPGFPQRGEPRKESVTHLVVVEDYFAGVLGGVEVHDAFDGPIVIAIGTITALVGAKRAKSAAPPLPEETVESVKADIATAKKGVK